MPLTIGTKRALLRRGDINWLLRDEFAGTLAAGSVNGTAAEPGPGTRTVVDTGNRMSISGGSLTFVAGGGAGDPSLWYSGLARAVGRVYVARITKAALGTVAGLGLDSNQLATERFGLRMGTGAAGTLGVTTAGVGASTVGTFEVLPYRLAVVDCGAGSSGYMFIRGGAFATWTLLWSASDVDASDPVYAQLHSRGADTFDWIRVPDALWLPTPLCYDTFTRANGALGNSEAAGPDGQTTPAQAWANRVGTTEVVGNVAQATALVGGIAIATVDTGSVNTLAQATLTRAGNEVGIVLRYVDADNYIRAIHDGTNCQLIKRVGGVETTVITAVVAIGAGGIVVVSSGTSFSLYLNNAQVGATSAIADAALQTGTQQGLFTTNVGNTQDAFQVFPSGTGNEYSALDTWSN